MTVRTVVVRGQGDHFPDSNAKCSSTLLHHHCQNPWLSMLFFHPVLLLLLLGAFVWLVVVCFVLFFETEFLWLSWNLICRLGWPQPQRSTCLCLPTAGIKGLYHHHKTCIPSYDSKWFSQQLGCPPWSPRCLHTLLFQFCSMSSEIIPLHLETGSLNDYFVTFTVLDYDTQLALYSACIWHSQENMYS
jgi:hypothetical protein